MFSKILHVSAIIIAILYTILFILLSLDAFEGYKEFWEALLDLLIHFIPVYFLIAGIIISWKYPLAGGIFFLLLSIGLRVFFRQRSLLSLLIIHLPSVVTGILFILSYITGVKKNPLRGTNSYQKNSETNLSK